MLSVIVRGGAVQGKSTIAAIIAQALQANDIPVFIVDSGQDSAPELLQKPDRLKLFTHAVAGREKTCGGRVTVRTQNEPRLPGLVTHAPAEFEIQQVQQWVRLGANPTEIWHRQDPKPSIVGEETRPHIVPLTDRAKKYVEYELHKPARLPGPFGQMYTGFGRALIGTEWVMAFRLKTQSEAEQEAALHQVLRYFADWVENGEPASAT